MDSKKVKKEYSKVATNEDPNSVYALRGPIGFAQRVIIEQNIIDILNSSDIALRGKKILDLGCGDGGWLRFLAELRSDSSGLYGIDLADGYIEQAKKINPNIKCKVGDITQYKYGFKFDVITAFVSFMYLTKDIELDKAIKHVARYLKPGGYFLFFDIMGLEFKDGKRSFMTEEMAGVCKPYGLELVDERYVFKNLESNGQEVSVAYLGQDLPLDRLLHLESRYTGHTGHNNLMLLFRRK